MSSYPPGRHIAICGSIASSKVPHEKRASRDLPGPARRARGGGSLAAPSFAHRDVRRRRASAPSRPAGRFPPPAALRNTACTHPDRAHLQSAEAAPPFAIFPQAGAAQANGEVAPGSSDNQPRDPP